MQDIQQAKKKLESDIKKKEEILEKAKDDKYQNEKHALLIKMGLCDKEYMPKGCKIEDYPRIEEKRDKDRSQASDKTELTNRRFRCKVWTVSDEDFEKLKTLYDKRKTLAEQIEHEKNPNPLRKLMMNNPVATYIRIAGIVLLVLHAIAGLFLISENEGVFGIAVIGSGVLTALLLYGFSEVIILLQEQVNYNK